MIHLFHLIIFLSAFFFMEFMAWFSHKYIMHGFLWVLHESHHLPRKGAFEKNDWFAVFFSLPSIALILWGAQTWDWKIYLGFGIFAYGVAYFLFHDVLVHRRVRHSIRPKSPYLLRIIRAHQSHHKHKEKNPGESFGFLWAPEKYSARKNTKV